MGLQSLIQDGLEAAFNSLDDLVTSGILKKKVTDTVNDYNPRVRKPTVDWTPVTIEKLVITTFTVNELKDSGILNTDRKILIKPVDLSGYVPTTEDKLVLTNTLGNSVECEIVKNITPPQSVLIKLAVRGYE